MELQTILGFTVASAILIAVPGPSIWLVVSHAMADGLRAAWPTIAGEALAHATYIGLCAAGLDSLFGQAHPILGVLKWVGAIYLTFLGIQIWLQSRSETSVSPTAAKPPKHGTRFVQGLAVTLCNPKALVFYAAFFPPFLNPNYPIRTQLVLLGTWFLLLFMMITTLFAILAASSASRFRKGRSALWLNRIAGATLIAIGAMLAFSD
ncbi:LysE family translocator [Sulfidibacter corallicola]|uniref:LysE family translocator n=1 Tax=Sulfidibacter corallicola TaxID=2818388 RepID=A0A8A4TGL0_SULCO|nr:LysE family translocator [Sulfidibacter corallicola]QTD49056.1 LysE family translocator [Sulfidibacter corallicola]